jgi:peptidoglycan/xylan/chitin deacetylase (PgdA/CDA1 family)
MTDDRSRAGVSIIVAARNSAATIDRCLYSLQKQTTSGWEAIVVDDGSSDRTADRVATFCKQDERIRLVRQTPRGPSRARNEGAALAKYEWLLFVDADDWLLPPAVELLTGALQEDPKADAVHMGWQWIMPDGLALTTEFCDHQGDLFDTLARRSAFPLPACLVRHSLFTAVGGFDPNRKILEDWDLWQRVARTGARFRAVRKPLACCRLQRSDAPASQALKDWLATGYDIIRRGYAEDSRVSTPYPTHAKGLSSESLLEAKLTFLSWVAGRALANASKVGDLFTEAGRETCETLSPHLIAENLFRAAMLVAPTNFRDPAFLAEFAMRSDRFLRLLEDRSCTPELAARTNRHLEGLIQSSLSATGGLAQPYRIGRTFGTHIEITQPIDDRTAPPGVDRLWCNVTLQGASLGALYLPVCEPGILPAWLLKDAIASRFAWPILLRFFEQDMAGKVEVISWPDGTEVRRGDIRIAAGLPPKCAFTTAIEHVSWTLLLQEVWGIPEWREQRFYDPASSDEPFPHAGKGIMTSTRELIVEISHPLPPLVAAPSDIAEVVIQVGGVTLDRFEVAGKGQYVTAQQIRAAVTAEAGAELCRAAVREGLLGAPLGGRGSLRQRLARAVAERNATADIDADRRTLKLGRATGPIGSAVSRRAVFPLIVAPVVRELAAMSGQIMSEPGPQGAAAAWLGYAPDLLKPTPSRVEHTEMRPREGNQKQTRPLGRATEDVEIVFSAGNAASKSTRVFAQRIHEQTLSLLSPGPIAKALELGCRGGDFTARLAARVDRLVAAEVSTATLERAAVRSGAHPNVDFVRLDPASDSLPGFYDLITCREALYKIRDKTTLRTTADKIAQALTPGGHLILAHANVVTDDPDQPGFRWNVSFGAKSIGETFAACEHLRLVRELRTDLYRIQLFQKESSGGARGLARRVRSEHRTPTVETVDNVEPGPEVMAYFQWEGAISAARPTVTDHLPILRYHRVTPETPPVPGRDHYVTPEAFEHQIKYLAATDFRSVDLEEWRLALNLRRPLQGRAVMLTFDGGYRDFAEYAWPVLKRYGFSAEVFLVASRIGKADSGRGKPAHMMDRDEIRRLQAEGVRFGSHTMSHRMLTTLSSAAVVQEAIYSRITLEHELGQPVTSIAFPNGDTDPAVEHLFGACGYLYGLSDVSRPSSMSDSLLSLPRITVSGSDGMEAFASKLGM